MRVSHSLLAAWERRDYETAISWFLGLPAGDYGTYGDGRAFHKKWDKETVRTGCLPKVFGGKKLNNPKPEHKIVKQLNDWLTLVGVMDNLDLPVMYEYKTGRSSAGAYANGHQHCVYQLLEPRLLLAEYYAYNQYTDEVTFERVHLNEETLRQGVEWVVTLASDMRATLENMGYDASSNDKPVISPRV